MVCRVVRVTSVVAKISIPQICSFCECTPDAHNLLWTCGSWSSFCSVGPATSCPPPPSTSPTAPSSHNVCVLICRCRPRSFLMNRNRFNDTVPCFVLDFPAPGETFFFFLWGFCFYNYWPSFCLPPLPAGVNDMGNDTEAKYS